MKKIFTFFLMLLCCGSVFSQNPVPNPGFELWTGTEPDGWLTTNAAPNITVTQTSPGYAGILALKGEVITVAPGVTLAPFVVSTSGGLGFPVTQFYQTLTFWYKSFLQAGDELRVDVLFNDSSGTVTGAGTVDLPASVASFTQITVPVVAIGSNHATCAVVFSISNSGGGQSVAGSYFIVDEVELTGAASVAEQADPNAFNLYPNPANDHLYMKINSVTGQQDPTIIIYDLGGREVLRMLNPVWYQGGTSCNISTLAPGSYIVQITGEGMTARKLFIRQ